MQTSLNLYLARTLDIYGDHIALLADAGIPPFAHTQLVHLAQLHFKLTKTIPHTIPGALYKLRSDPISIPQLHPKSLDRHIQHTLQQLKIDPIQDALPHMIEPPPQNRKKAYRNMMQQNVRNIWGLQLYNETLRYSGHSIGRLGSYVNIAWEGLRRTNLFQPAWQRNWHVSTTKILNK